MTFTDIPGKLTEADAAELAELCASVPWSDVAIEELVRNGLDPDGLDSADRWAELARRAGENGDHARAVKCYLYALRLDPNHELSLLGLPSALLSDVKLAEAMLAAGRATVMLPGNRDAWINLGLTQLEAGNVGAALTTTGWASEMSGGCWDARLAHASALVAAGRAGDALRLHQRELASRSGRDNLAAARNACFVATMTDCSTAELFDLLEHCRELEGRKIADRIRLPYRSRPVGDRPLRVGYVSGDFCQHSAPMIFGNVVLNHTDAVAAFLYSTARPPDGDPYTKMFRDAAGDRWRDAEGWTDEELAAVVRRDRIDVLVDLTGLSYPVRTPVFMMRPAPVQVTAWGFAHGTGCPEVDWFFADPVAVPKDERHLFAERVWDLPCIVTYHAPEWYGLKGTSPPAVERNGYFTFGCYARFEKLSDECLLAFRDILLAVPGSRLEFKDKALRRPYCIQRVYDLMDGIDRSRLAFLTDTPHYDHLLACQRVDLMLDPFPHCGGTGALEQLYMGLPLVTLYGNQPAGRTAASVLTAMRHSDFIAWSVEQYVEKASILGRLENYAGPTIVEMRKTLRQKLLDSPVCNGYVARVEEAYREMVGMKVEGVN